MNSPVSEAQIEAVARAIHNSERFVHHASFLSAHDFEDVREDMMEIARDAVAALSNGGVVIDEGGTT